MILASASPRRKELLSLITDNFRVIPSNAPEDLPENTSPEDTVLILSKRKALETASKIKNETIIAADTVVSVDNTILGKPGGIEDAKRMIKMLSGRTHIVLTGVCIIFPDNTIEHFADSSEVEFYPLSQSEIDCYANSGEPLDKAGAYAVQGKGALFVKRISGDFYNIVGLPVSRVYRALKFKGVI